MNILLVISSLEGGGAERIISEMADYWHSHGHRVSIASRTDSSINDFYSINNGINRIHLGKIRKSELLFKRLKVHLFHFIKLRRLITEPETSVVISFIDQTNILTLLSSLGTRKKIIVSERTDPSINSSCNIIWKISRKLLYSSYSAPF